MTTPTLSPPAPHYIPAASVTVSPDRQRKVFDPASLTELARSIKDRGLIHALTVKADGVTLVTGERRLRAIKDTLPMLGGQYSYGGQPVPPGCVPVVILNTDDPLELEELELAENVHRENLSWQEVAATTERLSALRLAQFERAPAGTAERPSVASLAMEIRGTAEGSNHTRTRDELIVAKHLHDPLIAKAPTIKDAMKILVKRDESNRMTALALAVGKTFTSEAHTVLNIDCLTWMADPANAGRFDVILTDPPYGMGAQDFGDAGGKMANIEHHYDDSYGNWVRIMCPWAQLAYLVAKPEAHAYVWCDIDRFHELKCMMAQAGWRVHRTPLTNFKKNSGRVPWPEMGPRRQSEWCLYAVKGDKRTNMIASDVIVTESDEQLSHGAQKPVALYDELLRRSVKAGDAILDSFGGTGTLLPAAHGVKCSATVLEQNPAYYGICLTRLQSLDTAQMEISTGE